MEAINFSLFTAIDPKRLSKAFLLNGLELAKRPGGNLSKGTVETKRLRIAALAEMLPTLTPAQALSYGVCAHESAMVVAKARLDKTNADGPVVARTRDHFGWPAGPGIMMFDYDPEKGQEPLTPEELRKALYSLCPALADAPHMVTASASSFIFNADEQIIGARGWRVLVAVADATDIPRAGEVLFKRAWLKGHGRIDVSQAGSLLVRGLVDDAVWQPERLDFIGGAACTAPLEQRRPLPELYNADAAPLDTSATLPDLSPDELKRFNELVAEAKREAKPRAEEQQELWIQERIAAACHAVGIEEGTPEAENKGEELRETLTLAVKKRILLGDFALLCENDKIVTVGELLDAPDKWHGKRFGDPLEPDYGNDRRIAVCNLRAAGRPYIWSHAHGGQRFTLHRARRTIRNVAGERVNIVGLTLELMNIDGSVFDRGGELVRVDSGGQVQALGLDGLRFHLDGLARFEKYDKRSDEWIPCDAPEPVAKGIIASRGNWKLPELRAVATAPLMDPTTGRIIDVDGHDLQTGILLHCNDLAGWTGVPSRPTKDQVHKAVTTLWEPFQSFPFVDAVARGVWLAAILLAPNRVAFPTAPGILVTSATMGSGKTLLTLCASLLAGDKTPTVLGVTGDPEETRKRMLAIGRCGTRAIILDNIVGQFESDVLCSWLTTELYSDRVLGSSERVTIPTRTMLMASGNNVTLRGDLVRRLLTCRIDPEMEAPWTRTFNVNPVEYVTHNRLTMAAAALTILKAAWEQPVAMPGRTASFETWSDVIRKAVCWIGEQGFMAVADPVQSIDSAHDADPELSKLAALLAAWNDKFADVPTTVPDAIRRANRDNESALYDALWEIGGERMELNARRIGRWIEKKSGVILGGLRFESPVKHKNRRCWIVRRNESPSGKVRLASITSLPYPKGQNCQMTITKKEGNLTSQTSQTTRIQPDADGIIRI